MNNFEQAQSNHDNAGPPDVEWNEPNDEHEEIAIKELADDPGALWDVLENCRFRDDFTSYLFTHCEDFRATALRENEDRINARKQELADIEYRAQEEEAATRYCP